MKDQSTNTEIDMYFDDEIVNDVKKAFETRLRESLNENARNSVSSISSGSKTSEYGDEKSHRKSQERKKVEFKKEIDEDWHHETRSRSRERGERLDYNKERKPERGKGNELEIDEIRGKCFIVALVF